LDRGAIAQVGVMPTYPDHKLGPYSASHRFREVSMEDYGYKSFHRFKPKEKKTKGYYDSGKVFYINDNETIELARLYQGEYKGKNGLWIHPYSPHFSYIFLGDVIDIEKAMQAAEKANAETRQELQKEERAGQIRAFLSCYLNIIIFICLIAIFNKFSQKSKPSYNYSDKSTRPDINSSRGPSYSSSSNSTRPDINSSRGPSYSSSTNSTSYDYFQPQNNNSTNSSDNSYQRFEFERRNAERASRINHIVNNCYLNDANAQELERLRREQNADNHFNS
jgi:hypothetical protein